MQYKIKNWAKFQHFKDRKPPWIKLYRDILDDMEWHNLSGDSAKLLTMLWLIASEGEGVLPEVKYLSFRLRLPEKTINNCLSTLSHWLERDDIGVISERYQDDAPEREIERETETDGSQLKLTPIDLLDLWNNTAHENLPRVQMITPKRETSLKSLLKSFPEKEWWASFFLKVNSSPFLTGQNGKDWKCNFDWVMNKTNMAKIQEGNYDRDSSRNSHKN